MKKFTLVLLAYLSLLGCNRIQWVKTADGTYIYGCLPTNKDVVWEGKTLGPLATGKGDVVILDKNSVEKSRETVETRLGAISEYKYVPTTAGQYLGRKTKDLPNGFGSLVKNDTLFLGTFKKGALSSGSVQIFALTETQATPCFIGSYKKGLAEGFGRNYVNGVLIYEGNYKKGKQEGFGREYVAGQLVFDGSFKSGLRNGLGKEYHNEVLIFDGEWQKGVRDGFGTAYNDRGVLVYEGSWKSGLYDGKGKLYENGQCIEGKWDDGRLTKTISTSVFKEIGSATRMWFSDLDSLDVSAVTASAEQSTIPASQIEFIEQLNNEVEEYLSKEFDKRVEKRFGFWHLVRMMVQPWFKSDIKRANAAQRFFCKNVDSREMENLINAKIDYYNESTTGEKLNYVKLDKLPDGAIVNTDTAIKVFEREAMETTDVLVGILVDILLCLVVAFIIGFIIGLAIPSLLPYVGVVDIAMAMIAFGVGLYLSVFRTTAVSLELEGVIKQMLVDNYMQFLDAQNIILQMLGLL